MWDTGHVHVCQRFLAVCGTEHWGGHHHGLEGLLLQLRIRTHTSQLTRSTLPNYCLHVPSLLFVYDIYTEKFE